VDSAVAFHHTLPCMGTRARKSVEKVPGVSFFLHARHVFAPFTEVSRSIALVSSCDIERRAQLL
jgi:hypothetical protein